MPLEAPGPSTPPIDLARVAQPRQAVRRPAGRRRPAAGRGRRLLDLRLGPARRRRTGRGGAGAPTGSSARCSTCCAPTAPSTRTRRAWASPTCRARRAAASAGTSAGSATPRTRTGATSTSSTRALDGLERRAWKPGLVDEELVAGPRRRVRRRRRRLRVHRPAAAPARAAQDRRASSRTTTTTCTCGCARRGRSARSRTPVVVGVTSSRRKATGRAAVGEQPLARAQHERVDRQDEPRRRAPRASSDCTSSPLPSAVRLPVDVRRARPTASPSSSSALLPLERPGQRARRDELAELHHHPLERVVVGRLGPVRRPCARTSGGRSSSVPVSPMPGAHLAAHHLVLERHRPAAVREAAAAVLVGTHRRLHDAVERDVVDDGDGGHDHSP